MLSIKRFLGIGAAFVLAGSLGWWADASAQAQTAHSAGGPGDTKKEVQGQIVNVDPASTKIQLADGTVLMIPLTVPVRRGDLKEGSHVRASYEERGDQNVVTSLQVEPTTERPAEGARPTH